MNKLEKLIAKLCPNGVEYKPLGEVCTIKNGKDYKSFGEGPYPVYGSGGVMTYVDHYVYDKPTVLIPRKGSIENLFYVDKPFWNVDTIFYTEIITEVIIPKFLYYYMQTVDVRRLNNAGGVPSLTQTGLYTLSVAVPPLAVQEEIVRMLDDMAGLIGELEQELAARKQQYEWYRDKLLKMTEGGYRKVTLGELGSFYGGLTGKSKLDFDDGNARFISYMNVFTNAAIDVNRPDMVRVSAGEKQNTVQYGDVIFTGSSETPEECGMSSVMTTRTDEKIYLNSFCFGFRLLDSSKFDPEFLKFLLRSTDIRKQILKTASGVTRFNVSKVRMAKVELPIMPISEQRWIAARLDAFDKLCNSMTEGLPGEIAARKQQYEYYRDRLLGFKRAG